MKVLNLILELVATFLASYVLQYGFNNLATDLINFRKISYFESFVIVELFSFILFLGTIKYFKKDKEETEQITYNVIYKILGYLFFLIIFVILSAIK